MAVALGKSLFYRQLEKGITSAYVDAAQTMACNMMDEAALEGVQAFIVNLGYGTDENLFPRSPRLSFEDAAQIR